MEARFVDPIFHGRFIVCTTRKECNAIERECWPTGALINMSGFKGVSLGSAHGQVIGVFDGKRNTLMHEALHAGMTVLTAAGIDVRRDKGEALCYYQEWIVREAMLALPRRFR